jgi:hypothetical protein
MSITFFLTPYRPKDVATGNYCFRLNPDEYKAKLIAKWEDIEFFPLDTDDIVLFWRMPKQGEYSSSLYELHNNYQTVTFGFDHLIAEFVHWHRSLIDPKCTLYFYNSSSYQPIEITSTMSLEEIQAIIE